MTKSIEALVPVILAKTEEGKIPWKAETERIFVADIGNDHLITIRENFESYFLDLRKSSGLRLDGVSVDLVESTNAHLFDKIAKIYDLARRQALKIDDALEDVERTILSM